jgi:hypothetical protein
MYEIGVMASNYLLDALPDALQGCRILRLRLPEIIDPAPPRVAMMSS